MPDIYNEVQQLLNDNKPIEASNDIEKYEKLVLRLKTRCDVFNKVLASNIDYYKSSDINEEHLKLNIKTLESIIKLIEQAMYISVFKRLSGI